MECGNVGVNSRHPPCTAPSSQGSFRLADILMRMPADCVQLCGWEQLTACLLWCLLIPQARVCSVPFSPLLFCAFLFCWNKFISHLPNLWKVNLWIRPKVPTAKCPGMTVTSKHQFHREGGRRKLHGIHCDSTLHYTSILCSGTPPQHCQCWS